MYKRQGLYKTSPYVAVKVPVFSFEKLANVDTHLGPEMKSTGEVLGIANTLDAVSYTHLDVYKRQSNCSGIALKCASTRQELLKIKALCRPLVSVYNKEKQRIPQGTKGGGGMSRVLLVSGSDRSREDLTREITESGWPCVGAEQEYFLIDRKVYDQRKDLLLSLIHI